MASDATISLFSGAFPGTPADIEGLTIRFKLADNSAQDGVNPVPIPAAGFNHSWRKNLKLRCPATGPDTEIRNLRFYSGQQSLGTDRVLLALQSATYVQGSVADETTPISAIDVDTYTTGSPLLINGGQVFGAAETGDGTQDFMVLQARVGTTAIAGNPGAASKEISYRYDET